VVAARQVSYGRIDPVAARQLFIQHALVEGDWQTHHQFFRDNQRLLDEAADLERRARRRGIVADDAAVFDFYDRRIPPTVTSARHFDAWWKKARAAEPGLLTFSPADLVGPSADEIGLQDYPGSWGPLPLSYEFAPGQSDDGVTVDIPLAGLNQVDGAEFGWQVPGLREELVTGLIRSLPKQLRIAFVPAPDTARAVLARLGPARGDLLDALAAELGRIGGVTIPRDAWDLAALPAHLRITFRVLDDGAVLASGKDLGALRDQLRPALRAVLTDAARGIARSGLRNWDIGSLPRVFTAGQVRAYPALTDAGDSVGIAAFETEAEAAAAMLAGTRRLILLQVPAGVRSVASRLPVSAKLAMSRQPYPTIGALLDDCAACAADLLIAEEGGPAWDAEGFASLLDAARSRLGVHAVSVVGAVARVLAEAHEVEARLGRAANKLLAPALADARSQLSELIYPGFVSETGAKRLPDLARYLRAIVLRLDKTPWDAGRDAERLAAVHRVTEAYRHAIGGLTAPARRGQDARAVRWLIEELRVSLFAQTLGTPVPVSEKRIQAALGRLAGTP
jgi:ATP-dependent helicase HrpA